MNIYNIFTYPRPDVHDRELSDKSDFCHASTTKYMFIVRAFFD